MTLSNAKKVKIFLVEQEMRHHIAKYCTDAQELLKSRIENGADIHNLTCPYSKCRLGLKTSAGCSHWSSNK